MSTRCAINFTRGRDIAAKIYRHSDGYPDGDAGVPADLEKFFDAVEEGTPNSGPRFDQPEYLAAKFVVWQADQNAHTFDGKRYRKTGKLDFIGVGVLMENPGDIEYEYFVNCSSGERPDVKWRAVRQ
jgi:hypothetical protein